MLTYIYVSDLFSPSRINTRQVLEPPSVWSQNPFISNQDLPQKLKIIIQLWKKTNHSSSLCLGLSKGTVEDFFHMFYYNPNKRNQMFQVFIYFNHSYLSNLISPKFKEVQVFS